MSGLAAGLGVCLVLASAPQAKPLFLPVQHFTLAWTHSIEKVRWEEGYEVVAPNGTNGVPVLRATITRIRGSAAGMEPPPDAVFRDGWYEYHPTFPVPTQLRLTRSIYTADYDWCSNGRCQVLSSLIPSDGGVTLLSACRDPDDRP